jgi:hypothetical protein
VQGRCGKLPRLPRGVSPAPAETLVGDDARDQEIGEIKRCNHKQRAFGWLVAAVAAFALVPSAGSSIETHRPRIIAAPRIAGLAVQGQVLSASRGRWSGAPRKYRYAWQRCGKTRKSCRKTAGARGARHLISARDVGSRIRLVVTASNGAGAASASSARTAVVRAVGGSPTKSPPRPSGYFNLQPVGSWSHLPSDSWCATLIRRSSWEPRRDNYKRNHIVPDPRAVHAAFAARPLARDGNYDRRWDSWLLRRVDGQFTGTTDEIFQWAACKWGLADNVLRGIAVDESTWYQYLTYPSGRCVRNYGCGDMISTATAATTTYCNAVATVGGYDYQKDFGAGICPETWSIVGIKSWQAPSWGVMPGNQNGTFPFNRNSTSFAVDYVASQLRGCYEGWERWLTKTRGDIWGCVGAWYSGDWHTGDASAYISRVQREIANHTWLERDWPTDHPHCSSTHGCPGPDPLKPAP